MEETNHHKSEVVKELKRLSDDLNMLSDKIDSYGLDNIEGL